MSINIEQIRERMVQRFSDVQTVDKSIIRLARKAGDTPFAVYYLDLAEDLPRTQEELTAYQDRVIGSYYFEDTKSLQWNNYLYFVTSADQLATEEAQQAKGLIEADRNYARKFVVSEEDLDSLFAPALIESAEQLPHTNVLTTWIDLLTEAGLDQAILSDDNLPKRLALIESSSGEPSTKVETRQQIEKSEPALPIHSLWLKTFRDFPRQRNFDFGKVNLVFGPNATGKTSLFEAIELFYCGRNKRNPGASSVYELVATFKDGRRETATESRSQQVFRSRNLGWYGQSEIKTNDLYRSFAQFNFLDTDAAASLAADGNSSRIDEDLSKLLVGPAASKVWQNIERVNDAVSSNLRDLRTAVSRSEQELVVLRGQLNESAARLDSDSIRTRLGQMMDRLGWKESSIDDNTSPRVLMEALPELISLARQAEELDWVQPPASMNQLARYCRESKDTIEKVELAIDELDTLKERYERLTNNVKRDREASDLLDEAERLLSSGLGSRLTELAKWQSTVGMYSNLPSDLDAEVAINLSSVDSQLTVKASHEAALSERSEAETAAAGAKHEYATFSTRRDQSLNLAQELREIATRILQNSTEPDECPLCHTRFGPGELARRIEGGADQYLKTLGQTLLTQISQKDDVVRKSIETESALSSLMAFSERMGLSRDVSVGSALTQLQEGRRALEDARGRLSALNSEIRSLESRGVSMARLQETSARLGELGYPLAEYSIQAARELATKVDKSLLASIQTSEGWKRDENEREQKLRADLSSVAFDVVNFRAALFQLKKRLVATASLLGRLESFSSSFPWIEEKPLVELVVEAEAVREVAVELQAALTREARAKNAYKELVARVENVEADLVKLQARTKRLAEANSVLNTLRNQHSLAGAMEYALSQYRDRAEAIFKRIHSPEEFSGLGSSWTTLVRKVDGGEATLSEISTGQRAAFALSIFLAQNSELNASTAPRVVLIDDPIAHVDDLNSLSFLDYLREVALTGQRQIFFATASDKLAALFERKFDFMGAEFRRFDLQRETALN